MTQGLQTTAPQALWDDDQMVDRFLQAKGVRSVHTRQAYARDLAAFREFLKLEHGAQPDLLRRLDAGHIDAYFSHLCELHELGEIAKATANRRVAAVSSLYRWCMRPARRASTGISFNPVDVDRFKVSSNFGDRTLSEAQVVQLIQVAANPPGNRYRMAARNAALLRFLYISGCRVSEAAGLTWRQFRELEEGAVATIHGKGEKTRFVRIDGETWQQLQGMLGAKGPHDSVFGLTRDGIAKAVDRMGRLIGVDNLTPHVLRHSHATHALQRGVNIKLIKDTLGHAQLNTTENYLRANPSDSSGLHLFL